MLSPTFALSPCECGVGEYVVHLDCSLPVIREVEYEVHNNFPNCHHSTPATRQMPEKKARSWCCAHEGAQRPDLDHADVLRRPVRTYMKPT